MVDVEVFIMDEEYICLNCGKTWNESDLNECEVCGHKTCPRIYCGRNNVCGGDVQLIKEYEEAMRLNND